MELPQKINEKSHETFGKIGEQYGFNVEKNSVDTITCGPTKLNSRTKNIIVKFKSEMGEITF